MNKNSGFLKSLKNALNGFFYAVKSESNLRVHLVIANLICIFAYFFKITRFEWMVLLIVISAVLGAELFNTAIERAVDTATEEFNENAKNAKDVSASATLIFAIFSVIIGIFIFGDIEKIYLAVKGIFIFGFSGILGFLILLLVLIFNIWLLLFCGRKKG